MTSLTAELARVGLTAVTEVRHVRVDRAGNGREEADRLADGAADLVVVDILAGSRTPALAAVALLLDLEPVAVIGTTAAPGWAERIVAVRTLLRAIRPQRYDLPALLESLGDPVLARTVQLLTGLADRRTPALLGSSTEVLAAALLAHSQAPQATVWWLASAAPDGPAGRAALVALGLPPLLDLGLADGASRYALAVLHEAVGVA